MKKNRETNKGITLIALVITIIVLLILAGVSIAMLTGENGILNQANTAKDMTNEKNAEEAIQMEAAGSFDNNGKYNKDEAKNNLKKNLGIPEDDITDNGDGTLTVKYKGYTFKVDINGKVELYEVKTIVEVKNSYVDKNTTVVDGYNNTFVLPEGFKVIVDETTNNADTVNEGIVIEDKKGNQFVWIPVGEFIKDSNGTTETVDLGRYNFDTNGNPSTYTGDYIEDTKTESGTSAYGNSIAKDITTFINKANSNKGYYLGRYEAGVTNYDSTKTKTSNSNGENNWTGYVAQEGKSLELVCKSGQQVWNYVTQNKAAELARGMYTGKTYESDLINSYAWDTAIVFIQKCGAKTNSVTYSNQKGQSIDTSQPSSTGTGILSLKNMTDEQCNIYDMAGNTMEYSTETYTMYPPSVDRGGAYNRSDLYTSYRMRYSGLSGAYSIISFRPLLYL